MKILRRIPIGLATLAVLLTAGSLIMIRYVGAWNIVFPSHAHDSAAPELPAGLDRPTVLVFTKTNSFRHKDGIDAGAALFESIAQRRGWGFFHTENGAVFNPEQLARFDAVVFNNATGDILDDAQETAFRRWLEAGGGWLGVHASGDGSHAEWKWYQDTLIGGEYNAHILGPQFQAAQVNVEDPMHPAAKHLPASYSHTEEWYSWKTSARELGFHVILSVDEDSYEPWIRVLGEEKDLRMGDHPIVWSRCVGTGRAIYSAMGHGSEAYATAEHPKLLEGALAWAVGVEGEGCQ